MYRAYKAFKTAIGTVMDEVFDENQQVRVASNYAVCGVGDGTEYPILIDATGLAITKCYAKLYFTNKKTPDYAELLKVNDRVVAALITMPAQDPKLAEPRLATMTWDSKIDKDQIVFELTVDIREF